MLQVVGMTREQFQSLSPQDRHTVGKKYRSVINAAALAAANGYGHREQQRVL